MNDTINIALISTPNHYLKFVASTLESIYENRNNNYNYNIYIFSPGELSDLDKKKLNNNYDNNFSLKYITLDENDKLSKYKNLKKRDYIVYDRLIIGNYLNDIEKLLYMDCDIIVNGDLSKLYEIDLGDNVIGAARDSINWSNYNKEHLKKYFNAGILLINLEKRNKENIGQKILIDINNNEQDYVFHDQDGLNYILKDKWKEISPKWNGVQTCIFFKHTQYDKNQHYDAKHPIIYHFAGGHYRPRGKRFCVHPNRREYFKYIFKTNYWEYKDIFLFIWRIITGNFIIRFLYKVLQHCFGRYK